MGTTRTAEFTASGNWTCPVGVSAVWLTAVGGGGATCAHFSQGAGSAELLLGKMIPVVPEDVYAVTVGAKGIKSAYGVRPTGQSKSVFSGFNALEAGLSTTGGGAGVGGVGGGVGGRYSSDGGANPKGQLECRHYTGGNGGTLSGAYYVSGQVPLDVSLGVAPVAGLPYGGGSNSGGAGAGALWGGTNGANDYNNHSPPDPGFKDASATSYGAGGGGPGNTPMGPSDGGNGADGYVLLMWIE